MTEIARDRIGGSAATIALLGAGVACAASAMVVSKIIAAGAPPFLATFLRLLIAAPLLCALAWPARASLKDVPPRDWTLLIFQSALGMVAFGTFLLFGLRYVAASDASVVLGTLPLVMAALGHLLYGERATPRLLVAIGLASAGGLLVVGGGDGSGMEGRRLLGFALIGCAVLSEALFLTMNRSLRHPIPALPLSAVLAVVGIGLAAVAAAVEAVVVGTYWPTPPVLWAILAYAFVPTVLGLWLWYEGSARASVAQSALAIALLPIVSLTLSAAILGEAIGVTQIFGCLAVVAALLLAALPLRKAKPE